MKEKICFLLPGPGNVPSGGFKMVYEYANRLVQDEHDVSIVCAGSIYWQKKSMYFKLTNIVRYIQHVLQGTSCRSWFPLDSRIKEHFAFSLDYKYVPNANLYVCTNPYTAEYLNEYPIEKNRKFYFIQGYENWGDVSEERLRETYRFPMRKIAISRWLERIVQSESETCAVVPNGFDFQQYKLTIPISQKNRYSVIMLYHKMERKACRIGFEALKLVKRQIPQLKVKLFGVPEPPVDLPDWYEYHQTPPKDELVNLYNQCAICLGTSRVEGWGLCIGEAMACGCAVVCTDNCGYTEMARNEETALVSPVDDVSSMAENLIRLLLDDALRRRIAESGHRFVSDFSIEQSYQMFRKALSL